VLAVVPAARRTTEVMTFMLGMSFTKVCFLFKIMRMHKEIKFWPEIDRGQSSRSKVRSRGSSYSVHCTGSTVC
jgi:hypothetical protein